MGPDELRDQGRFRSLADLPPDVRDKISQLGQPNPDHWVTVPIPALGDRSVIEVANDPDGIGRVREFLLRAIGKFS